MCLIELRHFYTLLEVMNALYQFLHCRFTFCVEKIPDRLAMSHGRTHRFVTLCFCNEDVALAAVPIRRDAQTTVRPKP